MADYVGKDFVDSYTEVLEFIKDSSNWDPSTSDEANPGVVTIKAFCLLADKLQYKIDINTAQAYLPTVTDRQTAFEILMSLGYVMKEAKSATGRVNMTLRGEETSRDVAIFTQLTDDSNSASFFTTSDVTITQGNIAVPVMEGSPFLIEKEGVDRYSIKDIDEDGRFFLQKSGIAQNGVFIGVFDQNEVVDYTIWKNIEGSVLYPKSRNFYYIMTDDSGENYIQFPKDFAELFGSSEFQVMATFTKGSAGNIVKGTLSKISGNAMASIVVRQVSDISNGVDAEDIQKAVTRYYETMQIFNTLVTAHDYDGALRYILQDGARIFSNAYARTAKDRQTKIITRDGTVQYSYRQFDQNKSDRVVEALCLKYSQDYAESFSIVPQSDLVEAQIVEAFDGANAMTAEIEMKNEGRLLAVTNLVGTIFANVSTDAQGQQVMNNVISALKGKYQSSEISFGQQLDYQSLINYIKAADNRIASVALNIPEYQIYKKFVEVDGESQYLDASGSSTEKTKIVAEAVLAGRLPLYKYLNRPNSYSAASLSDLRPIPFDADNIDTFSEPVNPQVTAFSNNTLVWVTGANDLANGRVKLSKNQVLQFNRILHRGDTDYGYGYQYAFYRQNSQTGITKRLILIESSTFTSGTVFESTSKLIFSSSEVISDALKAAGTLTTASNGDQVLTLDSSYSVSSRVNLLTNSEIAIGSIISNSSQVNGSQWSPFEIQDGQEYQLKQGETLYLGKSSDQQMKTFGAGTWIQPSGLTIQDNGTSGSGQVENQVLQATQKITILENDISSISEDFLYFMKLNGKTSVNLPYMLEDGEYFVYADSALSEYVILGAGTILETTNGQSAQLQNVISVEVVEDATESSFVRLGVNISAISTETTTYTSEDNVSIGGEGFTGFTSNLPSEYTPLTDTQTFTVTDNSDGSSQTFTSENGYRYRVAVYIASDENGQAVISGGVEVSLSDGTKTINLISVSSATDPQDYYISVASPFQSVLSKLQSGPSGTKLFPEGQTQLVTTYKKAQEINNNIADIDFPTNDSIRLKITGLSTTNNRIVIPLNLISTADLSFEKILFNMTVTKQAGQTFNFTLGSTVNGVAQANGVQLLGKAGVTTTQNDKNIYTVQVAKAPANTPTSQQTRIVITFSNFTGINQNNPLEILFSDLAYIVDYSDEVKYTQLENGTNLNPNSPEYYSPALSAGLIEAQIDALQTDKKFSWLCSPDEKVVHPTKPSEFFVSEHPRNYCTIPYIDFEKTRSTLRIISTSGAILK